MEEIYDDIVYGVVLDKLVTKFIKIIMLGRSLKRYKQEENSRRVGKSPRQLFIDFV